MPSAGTQPGFAEEARGKWTGEQLERQTEEIELIRVRGLGSADGKNRCGEEADIFHNNRGANLLCAAFVQ